MLILAMYRASSKFPLEMSNFNKIVSVYFLILESIQGSLDPY